MRKRLISLIIIFLVAIIIVLSIISFSPSSEQNKAEVTVKEVGQELSKNEPDLEEVYNSISKSEASVGKFSTWKREYEQLYQTYKTAGMNFEFQGILNSSIEGNKAVVWWKVKDYQRDPSNIYLKRTDLVKNNSGWLLAENVKISVKSADYQR